MPLFIDIALTVAVAVAIYQAFRFGYELAMHTFMRDHIEGVHLWHVECYELKQEIKQLNQEIKRLTHQKQNEND